MFAFSMLEIIIIVIVFIYYICLNLTSIPVHVMHFVKVTDAILDTSGKTLIKENVTTEICAEKCLSKRSCLAFEIIRASGKCYLVNETAATTKKIKSDKSRDFYQRIERDYSLYSLYFIIGLPFPFTEICNCTS